MRTCSGCQCEVPDTSETCPRCGAVVPRGLFASLRGLFQRGSAEPDGAQPVAPTPAPSSSDGLLFDVEDVFSITGRGTVATGRVTRGQVAVGDEIRFRSAKGATLKCRVIAIEMFEKTLRVAKAGETAGLVLSKVRHEDLERGTTIESA